MELSELKILPDEELFGRKFTVLEEKASKDNVLVNYYIDPKTHLIWRTHVRSLDKGVEMEDCKVIKLDTGVKLEDKLFESTDI